VLHLRVLGGLHLDDDGGRDLGALLAQPKRIALLAYLCVREPGSYCRRDSLLAVFWPESDEERARTALRGALHFLRRALGPDVVRGRGDGEVGVDPARLGCDAVHFMEAVAAGRLEDALALYRGDLLDGLFVSDAPGFERWVDEERARLRRLAIGAAATLTADGEARGDLPAALRAARRAVELGPDDETAARRLLGLLDRAGDRAGAIRAYEELAARLAAEYETTPAPETRALIEAIRGREAAARPVAPTAHVATAHVATAHVGTAHGVAAHVETAPVGPAHVGPTGDLPTSDSPTSAAPTSDLPTPRVPRRVLAAAAAVLLAIVAAGAWALRGPGAEPAAPSMDVVAVLPFEYLGGADLAYVGAGLPRLLGANLNGAGQLRTIDPVALERAAGAATPGDDQALRAAARRLGAGLVVSGQVVESGDSVRITADVARAGGGASTARQQIVVDGRRDRLFELVDDLTARLVDAWGAERGQRLTSLAARTTRSLPALRAYLEGEREYTAGRYVAAVEAFQRAVAADSAFALAYYRLSNALTWTSSPKTVEATTNARRFIGRLSRRDSLLVEARFANSYGHPLLAERMYRQVLGDYPDELEAWLQLGEVQYHWGSLLGRPSQLAEPAFARVLAFDSTNVSALVHLARIAASGGEGERARLDSLARRVAALAPGTADALEVEALRAFAGGSAADRARVTAALVERGGDAIRAVLPVAASTGNAPATLAVLRGAEQVERDPRLQVAGPVFAAELELARGRWRAARTVLDRLSARSPVPAAQYRAALAALPFLTLDAAELRAARDTLDRTRSAPSSFALAGFSELQDTLLASRRAYLLARLAVRLDDSAAAARAVDAFRPTTVTERADSGRIARRVRAEWAWRRGDAAGALRRLGEPELPLDTLLPRFGSFASADERFLRAELLRAAGRDAEALRWYETFPDPGGYDLHYLAPAHLGRARIHERRGERALAAAQYRRVAELWAECDPELRPVVDDARRRLAALGATR
jgi:DNA-binding SARP family transcriptional activator/TolB-like protein